MHIGDLKYIPGKKGSKPCWRFSAYFFTPVGQAKTTGWRYYPESKNVQPPKWYTGHGHAPLIYPSDKLSKVLAAEVQRCLDAAEPENLAEEAITIGGISLGLEKILNLLEAAMKDEETLNKLATSNDVKAQKIAEWVRRQRDG